MEYTLQVVSVVSILLEKSDYSCTKQRAGNDESEAAISQPRREKVAGKPGGPISNTHQIPISRAHPSKNTTHSSLYAI